MEMQAPDIRPATLSDIDSLVGLLGQLFDIEGDFSFDDAAHRQGLAELAGRTGEAWVWVAVREGAVVGMCTGQRLVSTASGGMSLHIEDVVVDRRHRGRGIGSALLMHVERWAVSNGFCRLQLNADRDNTPALDFYHGLGWEGSNLTWLRKHISAHPTPEQDTTS